jgi:hypothetical protein
MSILNFQFFQVTPLVARIDMYQEAEKDLCDLEK